jgi:hypothetical protein
MTTPLHDAELLRARWRRCRRRIGMLVTDGGNEGFGRLGLAARAPSVTGRFLMLPADPETPTVRFDDDFWQWWQQVDPTPDGSGREWSDKTYSTTDAAVRADATPDGWERYLAVHRHGGVEVGTKSIYQRDGQTYVALTSLVRLVRVGLALQQQVCERTSLQGPWEVAVALRDTADTVLSDFAWDWQMLPAAADARYRCHDPAILIRREITDYPNRTDQTHDLVIDLADHIEQSWGATQHLYLTRASTEGERTFG